MLILYFVESRKSAVYVSKEVIQSGDKNKFSNTEKEDHLARALKEPTDKLSNSHNFAPTGRFWEDYILHETRKWLHQLAAVGFTLNPEHCPGKIHPNHCTENIISLNKMHSIACFSSRDGLGPRCTKRKLQQNKGDYLRTEQHREDSNFRL